MNVLWRSHLVWAHTSSGRAASLTNTDASHEREPERQKHLFGKLADPEPSALGQCWVLACLSLGQLLSFVAFPPTTTITI